MSSALPPLETRELLLLLPASNCSLLPPELILADKRFFIGIGDEPNRGGGCEGAGLRADVILLTLRLTGATGRNSVSS